MTFQEQRRTILTSSYINKTNSLKSQCPDKIIESYIQFILLSEKHWQNYNNASFLKKNFVLSNQNDLLEYIIANISCDNINRLFK